MPAHSTGESDVLASKRDATRYQILVEIAERQPAVSQQEIADAIGITSQAVSNYLQELVENDHVEKLGRGRYEVTKEGVDWLISQRRDGWTMVVSGTNNPPASPVKPPDSENATTL